MKRKTQRRVTCAFVAAALTIGCSSSKPAPPARADSGVPSSPDGGVAPPEAEANARVQLKTRLDQLGLVDSDLVASSVTQDDVGFTHVRFRQQHGGVPVFTGEAIVHLAKDGSLFFITDALVDHPSVDTKPTVSAARAVATATSALGCTACLSAIPTTDLLIFRSGTADHLVHRVSLERLDGSDQMGLPIYFIDAHDGSMLFAYDDLKTASVPTLYSGTVEIRTTAANGHHYLEDTTAQIGGYAWGAVMVTVDGTTRRRETAPQSFTDDTDGWQDASNRAVNDAFWGIAKTLEYLTELGRSGVDDHWGPPTRYEDEHGTDDGSGNRWSNYTGVDGKTALLGVGVWLDRDFVNAFWSGTTRHMLFGRGDGHVAGPLVSLDIAGHELMHGVTEYSAALVYAGESGALNEAWSDALAASLVSKVRGDFNWQIGAQVVLPAGSAPIRYMDEPTRAAFLNQTSADHYAERKPTSPTDRGHDNGNVHFNSGIANKAFYLLAHGGTHRRGGKLTAAIGTENAMRIWYDALVSYMTSGTDFAGARIATQQAALERFGPDMADKVKLAWGLVGVGACDDKMMTIGECPEVCSSSVAKHYTVVKLIQHDSNGQITTLFRPQAINNRGDVVGITSGAMRRFQIWDHDGNKVVDEPIDAATRLSPYAINDSGRIAGLTAPASWNGLAPTADVRPFVWAYDSMMHAIVSRNVLPYPYSRAVGVNNLGQVLIHRIEPGVDANGQPVPPICVGANVNGCSLIWQDGMLTNADSATNAPRAINDLGQVTGSLVDPNGFPGPYIARGGVGIGTAFDALGTNYDAPSWTILDEISPYSYLDNEPWLINNSSKVVLYSNLQVFLFDGTLQPLTLNPPFAPRGMNDSDILVGHDGNGHGYVYHHGTQTDLTSLVADPISHAPRVTRAWRINNCGEILASLDFLGTDERCSDPFSCFALLKPVPTP